ncbi:MAG TPA: AsmA family protein [Xanthobacteraceae bacterium]|nr:AsmA family protein [Xanthobacteraceae bacterium]
MQTTLLSLAIVLILALVTALVGPLFVDWGSYRGEFEARASRLTGLDFHVRGAIDARLLPTPILVLQDVEFGRSDEGSRVRARLLRIEFSLGALARGEWRIAEARLEGPEFAAGLDASGRLAWPVPKLGFDLEGVSIARLQIEDGRASLADAASNTGLVLEQLAFSGEVRSLAGPVKGEGSFVVAGQRYPYRITTSRIADDGGAKVRFAVDPVGQPVAAEADVSIWVERGLPRFEGTVQLVRAVGRAPAGAGSMIIEPWRVTSHIKGDSAAAVLEQIEFQYGPDERAIKLRGGAGLRFGRQPEFNGTLSSPQIDLDRMLALPEPLHRRPLAAVKALADSLLGGAQLPIPAALNISAESVTLAGATLTRVSADLKSDGEGLDLKGLELRAPGMTQLRLSGRLATTATGANFSGSARVEAQDPRALVGWLAERSDEQAASTGPLQLAGDIAVGSDGIIIDRLNFDVDRMTAAGRLAYTWARDDRPSRLDAALTAPEIDFDRVHAVTKAILGSLAFDFPREGTLSLKIARAFVAGVEAKQADIDVRADASGFEIARLAIADFGGATLAVKGRIDVKAQSPRGAVTLDIDARALDGVVALMDRIAPESADQLRRSAGRLTPLTLRAALGLDPAAAGSGAVTAKIKLDARAGTLRVALQGEAGAARDALTLEKLAGLAAAKVNLGARFDADEGSTLIELLGLDRFLVVDKRPARLTLAMKGALDGDLAVDGQLSAGALNVATNGTVRVPDRARASGELNLKLANANVRSPRPGAAGRPAEPLPASITARLALSQGMLRLTEMTGTVAGASVRGRLGLGLQQQPMTIDGDIELGALDLPAAIAMGIGMPAQGAEASAGSGAGANASSPWPADPFERTLPSFAGEVAVKAARLALTPKLAARDVRGVVRFGDSELALQGIDGAIAGGRLTAELTFLRRTDGLTARTRLRLVGANAAELLPGDGSLSGRLTLDATAEGAGMSPVALVGSLAGSGSFTLENARATRLDPGAFDNIVRAVDQGLPIDGVKVRDRADAALARGPLAVTLAEGAITINDGQARLSNPTVRAQRADLAVNGNVNLAEGVLDARLTLFGAGGGGAPADTRPEIGIVLKGPVDAPKRTIDVAALASWLALRSVEQQSKKLDVLEGRAPEAPAQPAPASATTQSDPAAPKPPSAPKPKPLAPAAEQVQPLPPAIDVRPAPAPRAPRAHPATAPPAATPPAPAQAPRAQDVVARPRSLFEMLFGN